MQAPTRSREATVAAIAGIALLAIVVWHPGTRVTTVFIGLATAALAVAVGVRWARASRFASGRPRLGLRLVAMGSLAWAIAELLWTAHEALGYPVPSTASKVTYDAAAVLSVLGVAAMAATRRMTGIRTVLDGLIITASLLYVSLAVILGPLYRGPSGGLAGVVAAPLTDVLIASIAIIMMYGARRSHRTPIEFTTAGTLVMLAASTYYGEQIIRGTYHPGHLLDICWPAGFLILFIGTPRASELDGYGTEDTGTDTRAYLPYVPFAAFLVTAVVLFAFREGRVDPPLYVIGMCLTVLVLLRQLISLNDNRRLTRQLSATVEDLHHRAYHDPLTGLANRPLLLDHIERQLAADGRFALLYIDLDEFKPVNDTLGHAAGNLVLVAVAKRLRACVRDEDLVARLGGDEFALLLTSADAIAEAEQIADRVIAALNAPIAVESREVTVSASVGITYAQPHEGAAGELLRHADLAMYAAKQRGRNRAVTFTPALVPLHPPDEAA